MTTLNESNALIIGGSSGIGLAIAAGFRQAGARVAIAGRRQDKVEAAVQQLNAAIGVDAPPVSGFAADVTDLEAIKRLGRSFAERLGPLDSLVTCQGTTLLQPAGEFSEGDYDHLMDTNLKSVFFACTQLAAPMLERGRGTVITIASLAAHRGWPNAAVYAMTKHGVLGLTRTLAVEWAPRGVRINSISPGVFLTELNRKRMSSERTARLRDHTPLGRFGETSELVGAAVFLASDASSYVTGADLVVDGGYLASGI